MKTICAKIVSVGDWLAPLAIEQGRQVQAIPTVLGPLKLSGG